MQPHHLATAQQKLENFIFSFDFIMFCGNLQTGRTQAAYLSDKGAAASTPSEKKRNTKCRATQICTTCQTVSAAQAVFAGLRMQAHLAARTPRERVCFERERIGRAKGTRYPQPALFHGQIAGAQCGLSARTLCDSTPHSAGQWMIPARTGATC